MRRILRKIASGDIHDLGDITTLADPSVVEVLVEERVMKKHKTFITLRSLEDGKSDLP